MKLNFEAQLTLTSAVINKYNMTFSYMWSPGCQI